jgi:nucleoside-diphosphate-sugar epimerase
MNQSKTILITGGAGFIGSHLAEKFHTEGFKVIILDNLFRGKLENISHLLDEGVLFKKLDLIKPEDQEEIFQLIAQTKPDYIAHYAAINGTQYFYDFPQLVAETNSIGTYNLLLAIKKVKEENSSYQPLTIFASTSETYGEPFDIPSKETSVTYVRLEETRDSYAAAKLMSEFFVKLFSVGMHTDWMIFRIFNVYGPRMVGTKYGQVIPEFITRLRQGEYPLQIFGNGEHTRSFIYVNDHVDLAFKAITTAQRNEVYNLGNPEEISIKNLAEIIMQQMKLEPKFLFGEDRSGDHKRRQPSIEKLLANIGPHPLLNINKGVALMLEKY